MVLPFFVRSTEEALRAVSEDVRLTAAGLGLTRARALFHVVIPAASFGLSSALLLATGRALAETAALVFTSGYVDRMPSSLLDSGRSISIHIYDLSMNVPGGDQNAARSALVLLFAVCAMNIVFRKIALRVARV
jgi:phosphate transport system permease protein